MCLFGKRIYTSDKRLELWLNFVKVWFTWSLSFYKSNIADKILEFRKISSATRIDASKNIPGMHCAMIQLLVACASE